MRCTKCGYISFDHLQSCGKCSTDLQEVSALLKGTAVQSEPYYYLRLLLEPAAETAPRPEEEEELLLAEEGEAAEEAVLDLEEEASAEETAEEAATEELVPSLAVEAEDLEREIEMPVALSVDLEEPASLAAGEEAEEEEGGITLSLESVEEETPPAAAAAEAAGEAQLPEGLEMKDIAAPGENMTAGLEEIDLNDLMTAEGEEGAEEELALDEEELSLEEKINDEELEKIFDLSGILSDEEDLKLDLGEAEEPAESKKTEAAAGEKEKAAIADLDLDLDLELDDE